MTDTIRIFQKRAPRYDVKCTDTIKALIQELDGAAEPAELDNISERGAKLKAAKSYSVKETFTLKIDVEELSYSFEVTAKVCWVSPVVGDGWWLGCSFKPAIPVTVLDEFAQAGLIERREYRREPVSLIAIAKWELTNKTSFARIVDCSKGGFCMLSQLEGKPGERVQLQFEGNGQQQVQVRGKVVWQVESNDGYVLGCEFLDPEDFSVVTDLEKSRRRSGSKQTLAWKWFKPQSPLICKSRLHDGLGILPQLLSLQSWSGLCSGGFKAPQRRGNNSRERRTRRPQRSRGRRRTKPISADQPISHL
jgi:hypothetical protein